MRTATSPVTNGESITQEEEPSRDGDVISALKLQTEEIALVNACLKEVGEVEEATEVAAFLETLEDMVTDRAKLCERLVPALKKRFKGTAQTTYSSATRSDGYKQAREQKQFLQAWNHFKKGCLGLSKNSFDATRNMILGSGFTQGIIDGEITPNETMEAAVIRWGQALEKSKFVLGSLYDLIVPMSDHLFKCRVREDYRLWFRENREEAWDDETKSLMDLATIAKAYEETAEYVAKNSSLPSEFKKSGTRAVIGNVNWGKSKGSGQQTKSAGDQNDESYYGKCFVCKESGHRKADCPLWETILQMGKEYKAGKLGFRSDISVCSIQENKRHIDEIRSDLAAVVCATGVDEMVMSEGTQRAM